MAPAAADHSAKPSPLPTVSLVTPSFNGMPYLRAAIDSVLAQDYPHLDYLVMDGGSTDGTVELLRGYGERLRWVSVPDGGQAEALARGFAACDGEILGWLNADDLLKPGALRAAVAALQAHAGAALVYGRADFIDAGGERIGPCTVVEPYDRHRLLFYGDYIIQPAAFFTRAAYRAVGGLDPALNWSMDWDLWLKLAAVGDVLCLEEELASYRWLGSNKTATGRFERLVEVEAVARRHGCSGLPAYFRLEKARLLAGRAEEFLKDFNLPAILKCCAQIAVTVGGSWRAVRCLLDPHVWRNYRSARALDRRARQSAAG